MLGLWAAAFNVCIHGDARWYDAGLQKPGLVPFLGAINSAGAGRGVAAMSARFPTYKYRWWKMRDGVPSTRVFGSSAPSAALSGQLEDQRETGEIARNSPALGGNPLRRGGPPWRRRGMRPPMPREEMPVYLWPSGMLSQEAPARLKWVMEGHWREASEEEEACQTRCCPLSPWEQRYPQSRCLKCRWVCRVHEAMDPSRESAAAGRV